MTQPTERYAQFHTIVSVMPDKNKGSLLMRMKDETGHQFCLDIPDHLVGPVIVALMSQAKAIEPDETDAHGLAQPLTLTDIRPFSISDERRGIELGFDDSFHLRVLIPKTAIAGLRSELERLENTSSQPPSPNLH